jgi:hypothetical protein
MRSVACLLVLMFFLARPAWGEASSSACLRIASVAEAPDDDFGSALGKALYAEAGLCAEMIRLPTERLRRMLDKGELDGVVVRSTDYMRTQPELVAVPTPLINAVGRLYWRASQKRPSGGGHTVGFPRGWQWPRVAAESLGLDPVEVDNNGSLPKMVESGRIDSFLMADYEFDHFMGSDEERRLFASAEVLPIPLYHTVTREHADLVPALDAAIRRLEARGEVARLIGLRPVY